MQFAKETYLDIVKNAGHRYRSTRLRISAHDLEIERGRYSNIAREDRICQWCSLTMDNKYIEDEAHVLFYCDMYNHPRNNLIDTLKKIPTVTDASQSITQNLNHNTLDQSLMKLLSPYTNMSIDQSGKINPTVCNFADLTYIKHHVTSNRNDSNHNTSQIHTRSYVINAVSTFISKCFELKWKFVKDNNSSAANFKSIVVVLHR